MHLTNEEWDIIGDRINCTGRLTIQISNAIDRKVEIVGDNVVNSLGDYELSFKIARECEILAGRAMWDAHFANCIEEVSMEEINWVATPQNCDVI